MGDDDETKSNTSQCQDSISKDTNIDTWNPRKFLLDMRHQAVAASVVKGNESMTVDLLITLCHALLIANQEIWERCKPFHCQTKTSDSGTKRMFMFYRVGYRNVCGKRKSKDSFVVGSTPEVTKHSFEIPIHLPARLEWIITPLHLKEDDVMPNYELLFKRSMLLNDDVMTSFLLEFKDFLEEQQIALGEVDTWLLQSNECAHLLSNAFGVTIPCDSATWHRECARFSSWEFCKRALASNTCTSCQFLFGGHRKNDQEGWVSCPTSPVGQKFGSFPLQYEPSILLEYGQVGTIEFTCCLEIPEERTLLTKLVEFLRSNVTSPQPSHG